VCVAEGKSYTKFSSRHVFLNLGNTCQDRCVVVVCSVEFLCVILCVLYFLLLNMMPAFFMFFELYYQRGRAGQVGHILSTFMLYFHVFIHVLY